MVPPAWEPDTQYILYAVAIGRLEHGDYVSLAPIDLAGIARLGLWLAPGALGGTIQARIGAPDGPLVGAVSVPGSGSPQGWTTVPMPVTDAGREHQLFLVFDHGYRQVFFS